MSRTATLKSLPAACRMLTAMQAEGVQWREDYRGAARQAVAAVLQGRMGRRIDEHLERTAALGRADRRNGGYRRRRLTEPGDLELSVPRTRTFSALKVVRADARRAKAGDRLILACVVLGRSTRKVAAALLPVRGRPVSPATGRAVAKPLDAAGAAFHRRPHKDRDRVLVLDGVVRGRKTGAGALARPVLVALGLRADGKTEGIDFRLATSESAGQWEQFRGDLARRGLTGERLEVAPGDAVRRRRPGPARRLGPGRPGGAGAALRRAHDPQRREQGPARRPARGQGRPAPDHACRNAAGRLVRRVADRWPAIDPSAVACLRADPADLLTCLRYKTLAERKAGRTTNASERRFREVRRRTRPMGTFQDKTSMERILFAVVTHQHRTQRLAAPLRPLTHNP